ncbi:MAG TPA: hypothetical protein VE733_12955 [Streptosporangiaceae bacterium]|nr:hypothetical protein [Streptosporangiaceae bacterium]
MFALTAGAGAVRAGAWWGQHHGQVTVRYVTGGSPARSSHAGRAAPDAATNQPTLRVTVTEILEEPGPVRTRIVQVPGPTVIRTAKVPGPTVTRTVCPQVRP